jgi:cytochrome c oxidase subunit 3
VGPSGPALVAHQFEEPVQQLEAAKLGMWIFLATEIMFFGAMIFAYTVYRHGFPAGFRAAGEHMELDIGTVNTALLLTSSLFAALAVRYARIGAKGRLVLFLALTAGAGLLFDGLKLYEYRAHYRDGFFPGLSWTYEGPHAPAVKLVFVLYYVMTGVHAVHVAIGVGLFAVLAVQAYRGRFLRERGTTVQVSALYWHFVDIVWIFLYPLFYLIGGRL